VNSSYEILLTGDGSHTVRWIEGDVTFHSDHGAIQESKHVFMDHGLDYAVQRGKKSISIFEMGFGTGLNALLAWQRSIISKSHVIYHTIECYPLPENIISQLNYGRILNVHHEEISKLHRCQPDEMVEFHPNFSFIKYIEDMEGFAHQATYDLVFFDAFGPGCHPNQWKAPILEPLYHALNLEGALVTFCAQGAFKRELKSLGFKVESLPGPPGKREMTRAIKE
jgi:tRNA U34 5-methylaminomethyl-2-thiouridine-forming methyltransferase MnmC